MKSSYHIAITIGGSKEAESDSVLFTIFFSNRHPPHSAFGNFGSVTDNMVQLKLNSDSVLNTVSEKCLFLSNFCYSFIQALGVMVIENCSINLEPLGDRPFVFSIGKSYHLFDTSHGIIIPFCVKTKENLCFTYNCSFPW